MQNDNIQELGAAESHINVLNSQIGCDVTFEVGPRKEIISCHKIFLMARSSVFEIMFHDRWTNKSDEEIVKLPDVEPGIFLSFLKFIYADLIELADVSATSVEELLYLAEKYNVLKLKNKCEEMFLSMLELNNVIHVHAIAVQYSFIQLLKTTKDMMTKGFWKLISDSSFLTMDAAELTKFVESDDTVVDELNLFHALMNWSEFQCKKLKLEPTGKNLRTVLGPILAHIRFPIMGSWQFRKFVVPRNILTKQEKLDIFEYICLDREDRAYFDPSLIGFKVDQRRVPAQTNTRMPRFFIQRWINLQSKAVAAEARGTRGHVPP